MQTILKGRGLSFIAQTFLLSTTTTRRLFSSTSIRFKQKKYILVYKEKLLAKKLLESLKPPMGPVKTDSDLVRALFALNSKHAKSTVYTAPADPSIKLRSWKMMEHRYYDIPSPFPTLARGLFTRDLTEQDAEGKNAKGGEDTAKKYQIVVRGYDKFFNIGEVPWTEWDAIEAHTKPPYVLSLKSNGCIIFIAALTPDKLVVTSKHSLGPIFGTPMSHAQAGDAWLRKYLAVKGREEADLAKVLWEKNWTAIAELCDDDFEEHVLGYSPEKTGLHLHGLNLRSREFETMPAETVDAFAEEWGFIKTPHITLNTIKEVRDFTTQCAESGEWNGEAVEGFVVRTRVGQPSEKSPYAPGSSFFFKVKFDEPYMMYRDWREVTKTLLSKGLDPALLPNSKMKRAETKLYVKWVVQEIKRNPKAFAEYTKGKGIIATREKYLEFLKSGKGAQDLDVAQKEEQEGKGKFGKTIIVPVAVPGCGKTAVSVALARLFGFGHTQSDDVHAKKPAPIFVKNVMELLKDHDVVIADKNNHLQMHRKMLREATAYENSPVRLLALNWVLDKPPATIHRICGDRVQDRGENHQTLRAEPRSKSHEEVIWMFIHTSEELSPSEVDNVIDMELEEDLEAAVRRAAKGCAQILGIPEPSEAQFADALAAVQTYVPATRKPDPPKLKDKKKLAVQEAQVKAKAANKALRYFGLLPEVDIAAVLDARLSEPDAPALLLKFWEDLKKDQRYVVRPHVTIVHRNSRETEEALWQHCLKLSALAKPPVFKARLGRVLFNNRVMAVTVEDLALDTPAGGGGQEGEVFVSMLAHEVRERLHITVGTKTEAIKPVEAKAMVEAFRATGEDETILELNLDHIEVRGRVKPLNG